MDKNPIKNISAQLKDIAKDLSFLSRPVYEKSKLINLFPQHLDFIQELQDSEHPLIIQSEDKINQIHQVRNEISQSNLDLGLKGIFEKRLEDYESMIMMMIHYQRPEFYNQCLRLYGSSHEFIKDQNFLNFLNDIDSLCKNENKNINIIGKDSVNYLQQKINEDFPNAQIEVRPSHSLLSDSSAGRKVLKINIHKNYTQDQLNIFLAHEGWAHLGTSLNGAFQEMHPWLGTWAPSTTRLQEGLAIITELVSGYMTKERWQKIQLRHLATAMAEKGSSITEIYEFICDHQIAPLDAFKLSLRIFRGVPIQGGMAFTKELLYLHGLIDLLKTISIHELTLKSFWVGKMSFNEHLYLSKNCELNKDILLTYFPAQLETQEASERLGHLVQIAKRNFKFDD